MQLCKEIGFRRDFWDAMAGVPSVEGICGVILAIEATTSAVGISEALLAP